MASAPASTHAMARSSAASTSSTAMASVRAMTKKSESVRASTAALMRSAMSPFETISFPGWWPQRLATPWYSTWADTESVGQGKGGLVRVDIVGQRWIKKKKYSSAMDISLDLE